MIINYLFNSLQKQLQVKAIGRDGKETAFDVTSRLDTAVVAYFENGGILPYVLRKMMRG
jgi:aconitate hydratase